MIITPSLIIHQNWENSFNVKALAESINQLLINQNIQSKIIYHQILDKNQNI